MEFSPLPDIPPTIERSSLLLIQQRLLKLRADVQDERNAARQRLQPAPTYNGKRKMVHRLYNWTRAAVATDNAAGQNKRRAMKKLRQKNAGKPLHQRRYSPEQLYLNTIDVFITWTLLSKNYQICHTVVRSKIESQPRQRLTNFCKSFEVNRVMF